ncbi:MAG: Fe-S cluster assembly ATPase SufC, partial [Peptoniphilaceae bacterium]|nr:Fe-S cluster assembly ATPase SufC [Peptoniphilaceae bacterium]
MDQLLEVRDLHVGVDNKEILKGVNLTIHPGEIHVLMGPNGAGKSTLANAILAHPKYEVLSGDILFEGESILQNTTDERARKGIFLSFQTPQEVPGVTVDDFLRTAVAQKEGRNPSVLKFKRELAKKMEGLDMDPSYGDRYLNVGFSGGEKKKTEILQLQTLNPKLVLLDETDS